MARSAGASFDFAALGGIVSRFLEREKEGLCIEYRVKVLVNVVVSGEQWRRRVRFSCTWKSYNPSLYSSPRVSPTHALQLSTKLQFCYIFVGFFCFVFVFTLLPQGLSNNL